MSSSRILRLAQQIRTQTGEIDAYFQSNAIPEPSFKPEGPAQPFQSAPENVQKAKNDVMEAAIELRHLLEGPLQLLLPESNFAPLAAVYRFKIAAHVPMGSPIAFEDLARKCGVLEHDLRRIVRYTAVHHRVFCEPTKGFLAHTAASKVLAENSFAGNLMGLTFDECWPAHNRAVEAIAKRSDEANVSGYTIANNTALNTFQFLSLHPDRAQRFAAAMATTSKVSLDALSTYFEWSQLCEGSTVVDIGGSQGHVSTHLAQAFTQLCFVVQDLPEVVEGAAEKLPEYFRGRVRFMSHDMFTQQPVEGADVYLLRYVLHDWNDRHCVQVLRNLISALKAGAKIVVHDYVLPEPGIMSLLQEMQIRSMDAIMMSVFNSREREEDDWRHVFESADPRFSTLEMRRIGERGSSAVLVVEWSP